MKNKNMNLIMAEKFQNKCFQNLIQIHISQNLETLLKNKIKSDKKEDL